MGNELRPAAYQEWARIQQQQKQRVLLSDPAETGERKWLLQRLRQLVTDHEAELFQALAQDLGKSAVEAFTAEVAVILNEIDFMLGQLDKWQRPQRTYQVKLSAISRTRIEKQPYGSILIISPWNYPLQLSLLPAVGALAAGNSCFIKPSEFTPATSRLLAVLVAAYFPPEVLTVVEGDAAVTQGLLRLPWDFIFFTGSKKVGALIHQAAAATQTPVVLELGGKNPCIVDETNVTKAMVQRIVWGKFMNAGQTCIAPDTIYVHERVYAVLLELLMTVIEEFYGPDPQNSPSYGRLVHAEHFRKMLVLLRDGTIQCGGRFDEATRFLEPTVITDIAAASPLLSEEIFGPILPVIPYRDLNALVQSLQQNDAPLAVYLFSRNEAAIGCVKRQLRSGSLGVNQVIFQAVVSDHPFGGVGASGFGRYHGLASLDTFSYQRTILKAVVPFNGNRQYPPYHAEDLSLLHKLRRWLF